MLKENDQSAPLALAENTATADNLVFLKQLNMELQQIKKHLALEKGQDVLEQDEIVEKLQLITTYFWLWANEDKSRTSPFLHISSDVMMMQFQAFHLTSSCSLHIYTFPFDKRICNITVLSPMHSGTEKVRMMIDDITIEVDAKSRNLYLTNGEWKFNNIMFSNETMSGVQMKYSAVTYQRQPVLYVLNLIIPTSALFFLDLAISFTSASSSDKINLKITLILEISVLSFILKEMLRKKEESCDNIQTSKENAEKKAYVFLKRVCFEVKLMKEQLSAQTNEVPVNAKWNRVVLCLEKLFCYARFFMSMLFIGCYIIKKWRNEM
ncbi:hypothetical protein JD844_011554 [Phrynosoma platyrhinos]|uniref:Neurotransmitter-gated ion-channel ligand-binding domain-containing protein n=1 Tax=Phrynosoma platyrhinos TaxID=52577 RepID=A0ABQ7TI72_PHRPL|nr:hypothetical protein JD844_011554 [Phrynosoma platyrhinos]